MAGAKNILIIGSYISSQITHSWLLYFVFGCGCCCRCTIGVGCGTRRTESSHCLTVCGCEHWQYAKAMCCAAARITVTTVALSGAHYIVPCSQAAHRSHTQFEQWLTAVCWVFGKLNSGLVVRLLLKLLNNNQISSNATLTYIVYFRHFLGRMSIAFAFAHCFLCGRNSLFSFNEFQRTFSDELKSVRSAVALNEAKTSWCSAIRLASTIESGKLFDFSNNSKWDWFSSSLVQHDWNLTFGFNQT